MTNFLLETEVPVEKKNLVFNVNEKLIEHVKHYNATIRAAPILKKVAVFFVYMLNYASQNLNQVDG